MQQTADLSIIVPTYNESENVQPLINMLTRALGDINWEVIFVDDNSPDGTSSLVRQVANLNHRVRCLQRIGRRGLSSAVIEGILASAAPCIGVMDADLQHDESIIPAMLASLKNGNDLVVGSRYIENASTGTLPEHRVKISRAATYLGNKILDHDLSDPMSGFFMLRRALFDKVMPDLSGKGFKILLDIVASADKSTKIAELPYHMKKREFGVSKLSVIVVWEFFSLIANKLLGRFLPLRFILFVTIGLSGILVHLSVLFLVHKWMAASFIIGQVSATLVAMSSNYILNNYLTFNDRRHTGKQMLRGLVLFYLSCSLGALINFSFANMIFEKGIAWWLSGLSGAVAGAIWNFALASTYTWREDKASGQY